MTLRLSKRRCVYLNTLLNKAWVSLLGLRTGCVPESSESSKFSLKLKLPAGSWADINKMVNSFRVGLPNSKSSEIPERSDYENSFPCFKKSAFLSMLIK